MLCCNLLPFLFLERYWTFDQEEITWTLWSLRLMCSIPEILERGLYYIVAFSSALAVLNSVPCFKLDGQHIVKSFIIDLEIPFITKENTRSFGNRPKIVPWRRNFANALTIFGTVLLLLNVVLGCSKAFGFS